MYRVVFKTKHDTFYTGNATRFIEKQNAFAWAIGIKDTWEKIVDFAVLPTDVQPDSGYWFSEKLVKTKEVIL
jgi:hypothetical protein